VERAIGALSRMPELARGLLAGATAEEMGWQPTRERWSISQVLAHLIDVERAFRERSRRIVEEDDPRLESYDATVGTAPDPGACAYRKMREFVESRRRSVAWLRTLPAASWPRSGHHPRLGAVRLEQLIHLWAFHDLGHLRQMAEVVRAVMHWERIGPLQAGYRISP
jgi:DinB family protein